MNPKILKKRNLSKYLDFSEFEDRYGSELFSNEREDYKIADDAQAPEDYILGLGDQIVIQYYGAENEEFTLEIDRSGAILLSKNWASHAQRFKVRRGKRT